MPALRDVVAGPWRAVLVLGVTQILAWGALFYPPVLTLPLIAADRGWSQTFAMSGLSIALFTAGLFSPRVGKLIDRHGGHRVMPFGSLLGAAGLVLVVLAAHPVVYLVAWVVIGIAIAASLYDPAFATLGRIFGAGARAPITALTLAGGLASMVSWPVTYVLLQAQGWQGTYLIYAGLLVLVAAPLHFFVLPRTSHDASAHRATPPTIPAPIVPSTGMTFMLLAAAFATYAFVPSGASAHMITIFGRYGLDPAAVIAVGMLFGPAQVGARICELSFGRRLHPLAVARFSGALLVFGFVTLAVFGVSLPVIAVFMVLFGMANGLMTIARGTVPLALFGPVGYGHVMGRIGLPFLFAQAIAPLALAFIVERISDAAALGTLALLAAISLACFAAIRRPT